MDPRGFRPHTDTSTQLDQLCYDRPTAPLLSCKMLFLSPKSPSTIAYIEPIAYIQS